MSLRRVRFLAGSTAALAVTAAPRVAPAQTVTLPFENGERSLAVFPQKRPLIVQTPRPPQLETPFTVFDEGVMTPNDAFYVRWHHAEIPTNVNASAHRVSVIGAVARPISLSLDDLAAMRTVEVVAVNQCSGNSRGFSVPRVAGGQWGHGAMGNARWTGVRLRDILERAGMQGSTKQVQFAGMDRPTVPLVPDFRKALDIDVARGDDVLVAYLMNGEPLPVLNGYPVRLIVPGWYGTYWVKALSRITVLNEPDQNYWMKTAYRIPDTPDNSVQPGATGFPTIPINRLRVRSFITNLADGARLPSGAVVLRGIAFDGGSGIRRVDWSSDGGSTWREATLEEDYGKYSFRRWNARLDATSGTYALAVRATALDGSVQPATAGWNPAGYLRNAIETYRVTVS